LVTLREKLCGGVGSRATGLAPIERWTCEKTDVNADG
jgi:hypothetical protein